MHKSLILALAISPVFASAARAEGPDLSGLVPILEERFEGELNRYDGIAGLWSTTPRRRVLTSNGPQSVFLDQGLLLSDIEAEIDLPLEIVEEGLSIRSGVIPDSALEAVREEVRRTGKPRLADQVRYYTGLITTSETWSQTYGYFEITARMPRGKGHWPAFWLTHSGVGWPPEIDVFEAYGEGITRPTPKDNQFNVAVFFDDKDADGNPTLPVELDNPYAEPGRADTRSPNGSEVHVFHRRFNAARELNADIYDSFWTYAALWTPDTITFYFGKDRESLQQIYRTPTPADVKSPMYVIANDQITSRWGWNPIPAEFDRTFAHENALVIRQITVMAHPPGTLIDLSAGDAPEATGDSVIRDTAGDDTIWPGPGFDVISLSQGRDTIVLSRPTGTASGNKIIEGYGANDRVVLEGFPFQNASDALARLTQVGGDVWLPSGAYPAYPHTILFRDRNIDDFEAGQFEVRWSITPDIWSNDARLSGRRRGDADDHGHLTAAPEGEKLDDRGRALTINGGPGGDIYYLRNAATQVIEAPDSGVDTLHAYRSMSLPDHLEVGIAAGHGVELSGTDSDDRLVAAAPDVQLTGGRGDDLYLLGDGSSNVTVRVAAGDGHDRIVGLRDSDRLQIDSALRGNPAELRPAPAGSRFVLILGPDQSLTFVDASRAAIEAALKP